MKTDNSHFEEKISLREEVLSLVKKNKINILEMYAGKGMLWNNIKRRSNNQLNITSIEKEKGKNLKALEGDNLKFLPNLDVSKYDIIDLDAYGIPSRQIEILKKKGFKGYVIVTAIQAGMGVIPTNVLLANGFTKEMIKKSRSIFNNNGIQKLKNFLYICGVRRVKGYFFKKERKNYFYFKFY